MSGVFESIAPPPYDPSGWDYESPQIATRIPSSGEEQFIHVLHGLGKKPSKVQVDMICTSRERGFVVGDVLLNVAIANGVLAASSGFTVYASGKTKITLVAKYGFPFQILCPDGSIQYIGDGSWDYIVKASL